MTDTATRQRLLDCATHLFSERGFARVTVRDICREAKANGAAVNYYFGGKLELYREVVEHLIKALRGVTDLSMETPPGSSAEDRLRHYVVTFLSRLTRPEGEASWIQQLMQHEMRQPSPIASLIVERAILPRMRYLGSIIASLLQSSPDDPRVLHSAVSLQAQCLFASRLFRVADPFRTLCFPNWPAKDDEQIEWLAKHIVDFSLGGIERLRNQEARA